MLINYGEKLMATILDFKLPRKSRRFTPSNSLTITTSINDVMLIIHHALHGSEEAHRPKDLQLAAQLLDMLSVHIKDCAEKDCLVLSHTVSSTIMSRYPEMC